LARRQDCKALPLAASRKGPDLKRQYFKYLRHRKRCCGSFVAEPRRSPFLRRDKAGDAGPQVSQDAKAGRVPMDRALGRIGFMSTQRRENRWQRPNCAARAEVLEHTGSASETRQGCAVANGGTAPLTSIIWLAWAWFHSVEWLATNSLLSDLCIGKHVRLGIRCVSPPLVGDGRRPEPATQATHRSSLPHIPHIPARTRLHPSLPQAPAGISRWAERYDGKGNLYLQHAA